MAATAYVTTHLVHRRSGRFLLARRAGTSYMPGFLSCVAGHVEAGESPASALAREVREEIGVDVALDAMVFRSIVHRLLPDRICVDFFFEASGISGEPAIMERDKISELGWFDLAAVAAEVVPYVRLALTTDAPHLALDETRGPAG